MPPSYYLYSLNFFPSQYLVVRYGNLPCVISIQYCPVFAWFSVILSYAMSDLCIAQNASGTDTLSGTNVNPFGIELRTLIRQPKSCCIAFNNSRETFWSWVAISNSFRTGSYRLPVGRLTPPQFLSVRRALYLHTGRRHTG